jgi:hypothetical protein
LCNSFAFYPPELKLLTRKRFTCQVARAFPEKSESGFSCKSKYDSRFLPEQGVQHGRPNHIWEDLRGGVVEAIEGGATIPEATEQRDVNISSVVRSLKLYRKSGLTDDAELLFKRAIAIGEKALGLGHPLTQRYCSDCARLFLDTGRGAEALSFARAALATHERASGPNHRWTKDSARVTADALDAQCRTEEATELRARYGIDGP